MTPCTIRRILLAVLFLLSSLAATPAPDAAAGELDALLDEIYFSPFEPSGDTNALAARLVELLESGLGHPAEYVAYTKLQEIYGGCADPRPIDRFIEAFAEREHASGFVRLMARADKRWALTKRGQVSEADALKVFEPYARNVLVAGPFGFYCRSLHDVSFPPERELDAAARYRGYGGDVGWQLAARRDRTDSIDPFDALHPRAGCCYVLYQFFVPEACEAVVSFEYRGSSKVWFNDALVLDQDRDRAVHPKAAFIPVAAATGWNRVLLKLTQRTTSFMLIVTDPEGYPLEGLRENETLTVRPVGAAATKPAPTGVIPAYAVPESLEAHVRANPSSAAAHLALADCLVRRGLPSRALTAALAARDAAPESAHVACYLGRLYQRCAYLPQNYRNNRSREMFEKAIALDGAFLPARVGLARQDHRNDRSEAAIESLRDVLDANPSYYRARMTLTSVFKDRGWQAERLESARKAVELAPFRDAPHEEIVAWLESHDRHDLAGERRRNLYERNGTRTDLMLEAASFARDRGDMVTALSLCERAFAVDGSDAALSRKAYILRAMGDDDWASALTELCRRHPGDPKRLVALADALLEEGRKNDAIRQYEKALAVAPDLHDVRALLCELGAEGCDDPLFDSYRVDGGNFITGIPGKEDFPRASAILALDHMITRVHEDGSSRSRVHQVVKILDKDAVEDYGEVRLPGRIEIVRVYTPDGRILEPVDASESGTFSMPGVDVGCFVETCFTVREGDSLGKPLELGTFYYQDAEGKQPFIFSRNVVILPKDLPINEELKVPAMFEREVIEREEDRVYVYTARNTPVAELENNMPPDEEAFPNNNFIQYRDWVEIAQILANIHSPDVILFDEIRRKAAEVAGGIESPLDKARALYTFVNDLVKDDDGSDEAIDVLLEACGDRANLFMALLDAAEVEYDYLRCGIDDGYRAVPVDWNKLDLGLFSRALIRIRGAGGRDSGTLVSMDSRLLPFGVIPPHLYGAPAIKVTGKPERIERIPGGADIANLNIDISLDAVIEGDDAKISGTLSFPGFNSSSIKEQMQRMDRAQRKQAFEYGLMRSVYPGARLLSLEISGIDEVDAVPTFAFELHARNFVQPSGDGKACRLLPRPPMLTRTFIRKPTREYPMLMRGYSSQRFAMTVNVGDGYRLDRLPASLVERSYFLNYSLITARTDSGYRMEQVAEFLPGDVEPNEYPDLITRLTAIDERTVEPVVLSAN